MKNRESGERNGMPESVFAFAFANGKCFVYKMGNVFVQKQGRHSIGNY